MADTFTLKDALQAAKTLKEHNVPPAKCGRCGAEFYLLDPPGERASFWQCDCGAKNPLPEHGGFLPVSP